MRSSTRIMAISGEQSLLNPPSATAAEALHSNDAAITRLKDCRALRGAIRVRMTAFRTRPVKPLVPSVHGIRSIRAQTTYRTSKSSIAAATQSCQIVSRIQLIWTLKNLNLTSTKRRSMP